jgi:hypothetical protein
MKIMNVDSLKVELIDWIAKLNDNAAIERIISLKKELTHTGKKKTRVFGSGKHLISFIANDFNEPLDIFKEYQK